MRKNTHKNNNPLEPHTIFIFENFKLVTDDMVPGIVPNAYLISDYGRIWSYLTNQFINGSDSHGYRMVRLRLNNTYIRETIPVRIHRLVALAFIPKPIRKDVSTNELVVNHINGIKTDNRACNLEWCSVQENVTHAIDTGLNMNYGSGMYNAHFNEDQIKFIAESLMNNVSYYDICISLGIPFTPQNRVVISRIRRKQTYSKMTKEYDFSNYDFNVNGKLFNTEEIHKICQTFCIYGTNISVEEIMDILGKKEYYYSLPTNVKQSICNSITSLRSKKTFKEICSMYNY